MTKIRIIHNNLWRKGTIFYVSSEHPQFPGVDTQADTPSQFWRSQYGAGSGNGVFNIIATRKYIDFDEGGAELTGEITTGNYNGNTLATAIAAAMNAAPGKTLTYACTYSETAAKFTISAGSNFTIRWNTGTHKATDISDVCGYSDAANDTGANSYLSDNRRIYYPNLYADNDFLAASEINFIAVLNHNISSSATIKWYGADDSAFTVNLENVTIPYSANNIFYFLPSSHTKRYHRFFVQDETNPNSYIQTGPIIMGKYWQPNRSFSKNYTKGKPDDSIIDESFSLVEYAQDRPRRLSWSLPFDNALTEADAAEVISFFENVGLRYGFVICFDYNYPNSNSYFVKNTELIEPAYQHYDCWSWALKVREKL